MDEMVTYYSSHKSKTVRIVKLESVLSDFKNGKYADKITEVRTVLEQQGEQKYRDAKKTLPAVAFCGEFVGGHAKDNLIRHNNLIVIDIDHLSSEEMRTVYNKMASDECILAFWVSPSGNGYKGLLRINYKNIPESISLDLCYKKAFVDVCDYLFTRYGIVLDTNCSDFSRICYVCSDENLYVNEKAAPFDVDCSGITSQEKKEVSPLYPSRRENSLIFKTVNIPGKNSQHDRNVINSILKYLTKRNISITYSYDDWLRVGFAIANTFNYDIGIKYYIAFSKLDSDKYDEAKCIEKLQECYMSGRGEITLGTIVEMARSKGYKGCSED